MTASCSRYNETNSCSVTSPSISRVNWNTVGWNQDKNSQVNSWSNTISHNNRWYAVTTSLLKSAILSDYSPYLNNPDFSKIAVSENYYNNLSETQNGYEGIKSNATYMENGLFAADDDYTKETNNQSYYFRGSKQLLNNNVIFDKKQWKIIRITGNGDIKLIYNGKCIDEICKFYGTGINTAYTNTTPFNSFNNDNAYIGYMYGEINPQIGSDNDKYNVTHQNIYKSAIMEILNKFYEEEISEDVKSIITDTIYCNDRSVISGVGYGQNYTTYGALDRLFNNRNPQLTCPNLQRDGFTVGNAGNSQSDYPIGLITADEVVMAGGVFRVSNRDFYLYVGLGGYTLSPISYSSGSAQVGWLDTSGHLGVWNGSIGGYVTSNSYVRPVISIRGNVIVTGDGSLNNPYRV